MSAPVFEVITPDDFLEQGIFREDAFLKKAAEFDWSRFESKMVLVRGCSTIAPPWIYMLITARLQPYAKTIRYGNEHDNVVVYRRSKTGSEPNAMESDN